MEKWWEILQRHRPTSAQWTARPDERRATRLSLERLEASGSTFYVQVQVESF